MFVTRTGSKGKWSQCQPARVQETFGLFSQTPGVTLGDGILQGQEVESMVLVGPFQLSWLCNSVKYQAANVRLFTVSCLSILLHYHSQTLHKLQILSFLQSREYFYASAGLDLYFPAPLVSPKEEQPRAFPLNLLCPLDSARHQTPYSSTDHSEQLIDG